MNKHIFRSSHLLLTVLLIGGAGYAAPGCARAQTAATAEHGSSGATAAPAILTRDQAGVIMPATVFFRGQSAPIQARNSAGLRLTGDKLVLAAMVDTSGYSSGIAQRYQAYLITEVALRVGNKTLAPGAYGFGFLEGDKMVLMDLGGNEILTTSTVRDPALTRPTPLQMLKDPGAKDRFRLFLGRSYVVLAPG